MKASEIIKSLQENIEKHGDLEVYQIHRNGVFGKTKTPIIAFRSKANVRDIWGPYYKKEDQGEKVFKI